MLKPLTEKQYLDLHTELTVLRGVLKTMRLREANGLSPVVFGNSHFIEGVIAGIEHRLVEFENTSPRSRIVLVNHQHYRTGWDVKLRTMSAEINSRAGDQEEEIDICSSWAEYLGFPRSKEPYLARITVERLAPEPISAESPQAAAASEPANPEPTSGATREGQDLVGDDY